ncbi:hypothetical protein ILYODFUR_023175 [Ilyodon furcidens]|uniref:Uncharacterized protein n=1 Tax=Ilyodon furcidens TaxID=33524 RepID=A0ABV0SNK1_9TELE
MAILKQGHTEDGIRHCFLVVYRVSFHLIATTLLAFSEFPLTMKQCISVNLVPPYRSSEQLTCHKNNGGPQQRSAPRSWLLYLHNPLPPHTDSQNKAELVTCL